MRFRIFAGRLGWMLLTFALMRTALRRWAGFRFRFEFRFTLKAGIAFIPGIIRAGWFAASLATVIGCWRMAEFLAFIGTNLIARTSSILCRRTRWPLGMGCDGAAGDRHTALATAVAGDFGGELTRFVG